MGYYIIGSQQDTPDDLTPETFKQAMLILEELVEQSAGRPLLDVEYAPDGTIPITVDNIVALQEGIMQATNIAITPEEALDALFQYNEETLNDSL